MEDRTVHTHAHWFIKHLPNWGRHVAQKMKGGCIFTSLLSFLAQRVSPKTFTGSLSIEMKTLQKKNMIYITFDYGLSSDVGSFSPEGFEVEKTDQQRQTTETETLM